MGDEFEPADAVSNCTPTKILSRLAPAALSAQNRIQRLHDVTLVFFAQFGINRQT